PPVVIVWAAGGLRWSAGSARQDSEEGLDVGIGAEVAVVVEVGRAAGCAADAGEAGEEGLDVGVGAGVAVVVEIGGARRGGDGGEEETADVAVVEAFADDQAVIADAVGGVEPPARSGGDEGLEVLHAAVLPEEGVVAAGADDLATVVDGVGPV